MGMGPDAAGMFGNHRSRCITHSPIGFQDIGVFHLICDIISDTISE